MKGWRWQAGKWLHHAVPATLGQSGPNFRRPAVGERAVPASDDLARTTAAPISPGPAAPNPILTGSDLGPDVAFVADPFLWIEPDRWHLFVEVYRPERDPPAAIGHLHSDDRGATWRYSGLVLDPGIHLAFPFVFAWQGERYMLPDPWTQRPGEAADFTLYRAERFPEAWVPVATPVSPTRELHDAVVFRHDRRWWALAGEDGQLRVYYAEELCSDDWTPHRGNPVVTGRPSAVRPAGRPIAREDGIVVPFQDCSRRYGERVLAYEVRELTPSTYRDGPVSPDPALAPTGGLGWNSGRMHHLDAWLFEDRWLCAVDGNVGLGKPLFGDHWAIGLYEQPLDPGSG